MERNARWASRLSGFALSTALTGAVGFATIPALIAIGGGPTWAVIAFGQAVGVLGTMLIGWGWGISGAAEAALDTADEADHLLLRSIAIRSQLVLPVVLVGGALAFLLAPQEPLLAAMSAAAYSLAGMSAQWFYTGVRDPRALILREVLPRTGLTVVGLVVSAATGSSYPFPVFLAAGSALAVALNAKGAGSTWLRALTTHGRQPLPELRRQFPLLVSTLVSTTYLAAPTILVGVLAPQQLVVYALADRLYRTANMVGLPILNVLQGAIPSRDPAVFQRRVTKALRALSGLGLLAALLYAFGAPLAAPLLTGGRHALPLSITIPFGVTLMASYLSQVLGLSVLITLGRLRAVVVSTTAAAALGVPVLVLGTLMLGAPGAAIGVVVAEGAMTLFQLVSLRRGMQQVRATGIVPGAAARSQAAAIVDAT